MPASASIWPSWTVRLAIMRGSSMKPSRARASAAAIARTRGSSAAGPCRPPGPRASGPVGPVGRREPGRQGALGGGGDHRPRGVAALVRVPVAGAERQQDQAGRDPDAAGPPHRAGSPGARTVRGPSATLMRAVSRHVARSITETSSENQFAT